MARIIIGVMGPGEGATEADRKNAYLLGKLIAREGWVLLTGGRAVGVMASAMEGAKSVGGLTVGILPEGNRQLMSPLVDIPILTDLGNARNNVNVLSSDVVIAVGVGVGTISEIALALKNQKKVILLNQKQHLINLCRDLAGELTFVGKTPQEAINLVSSLLPPPL